MTTPRDHGVFATIDDCTGEAHRNPYIDNCPVCAPKWGIILRCANCGERLKYNRQAHLIRRCSKCGTTHADVDYYEIRARDAAHTSADNGAQEAKA